MNEEYINKPITKTRILLVPLDWGLGHATRCIPIIKSLQKCGASILLAGEGTVITLLKKEFPAIEVLPLQGYKIRYGKKGSSLLFTLLRQLPRIISTIRQENRWLQKAVTEHNIDAVISDNRFGLYHKKIPCVYITHQLSIQTGYKWLNNVAQKINYQYINRFSECWIPDAANNINLAGKLSHPLQLPQIPVKYLGPLSRFKKKEQTPTLSLLILLSGPEPQRSIFEKELMQQLKNNKTAVVLVRGLPNGDEKPADIDQVKIYNHLAADELSSLIQQSEWVLARAGYSTIMDLVALQKKAILVPTPGQGEQEYLGTYLHQQQLFFSCPQKNFNLKNTLQKASAFTFNWPANDKDFNAQIITEWLNGIKKAMV